MALAAVLRACGDEDEARDAALRAHQFFVAKDHTVGAMRARAAHGGRPALAPRARAAPSWATTRSSGCGARTPRRSAPATGTRSAR